MSSIDQQPVSMRDASGLPEGWAEAELGLFIRSMANGIYKPDEFYCNDGVPCLRMYNIQDGDIVLRNLKRMRLSQAEVEQYQLLPNDILVNRVNSRELVGKAAICPAFPEPTIFESKNIRLRLEDRQIVPAYANYLLMDDRIRQRVTDSAKQTVGMATVSQPNLRCLVLPLPPVPEQKRIAAKIQASLTQLSKAKARLTTVPQILKRFRQSVLAAACSGRLTEDWRIMHCDVEPAAVVLDRIMAAKADLLRKVEPVGEDDTVVTGTQDVEWEVPSTWQWVRLDRVLHPTRSAGYGVLQPGQDLPAGVPMVRVCDIQRGTVVLKDLKRIDPDIDRQYKRTRLQGSEVLVTLVGTIGRTAVVPPEAAGANIARAVAMLPLTQHVVPRFVESCLATSAKNAELVDLAREVARKTLNLGLLKSVRIPIAPVPEQHEIVHRVNTLFKLADTIEARVAVATARAERITQAILAKAFRGQLVPPEAELARREGRDYEPASVLLERIRAERAAAADKPKPRRERPSQSAEPQLPAATPKRPQPDSWQGGGNPHDNTHTSVDGGTTLNVPANETPSSARPDTDGDTPTVPIDQTDRGEVMAVIREVFTTGGARTRDDAIHDIAQALGYGRVGSRIRDTLNDDIRTAVRRGILQNENGQLSLLVRQVNEYALDHLVDMLVAGMGRTWWDRQEIIMLTARWLGFRRTGPVIQKALKSAINAAIRRGLLESKGDAVRRL